MTEWIHAFSVPLGPAQPGLADRQMNQRKSEAHKLVRATMPSTRNLVHGVLQERTLSHDGLLWLAFDLVETPQMQLPGVATSPRARKALASALNGLYSELARLKEEAEATVIRVGELAAFSARLATLSGSDFQNAIASLPDEDWELWRLIHSRKGKRLSIEFSSGSVGITMPLFPTHVPEPEPRHLRFSVRTPRRDKIEILMLDETKQSDCGSVSKLPKKLDLVRPMGRSGKDRNNWFLLYGAEFRNLVVEATVRVALRLSDLSPSHLELIEISNAGELASAIPKIDR